MKKIKHVTTAELLVLAVTFKYAELAVIAFMYLIDMIPWGGLYLTVTTCLCETLFAILNYYLTRKGVK